MGVLIQSGGAPNSLIMAETQKELRRL